MTYDKQYVLCRRGKSIERDRKGKEVFIPCYLEPSDSRRYLQKVLRGNVARLTCADCLKHRLLRAVNIELLYALLNRHADCTAIYWIVSEKSELHDGKGKIHNHSKRFYSPLPFRVIFSFNNTEQFAEHTLLEFIYAIPLKYSFTYIFICTKNS